MIIVFRNTILKEWLLGTKEHFLHHTVGSDTATHTGAWLRTTYCSETDRILKVFPKEKREKEWTFQFPATSMRFLPACCVSGRSLDGTKRTDWALHAQKHSQSAWNSSGAQQHSVYYMLYILVPAVMSDRSYVIQTKIFIETNKIRRPVSLEMQRWNNRS